MIHLTLSGDVFLKSRRTRPRMTKRALANLESALSAAGVDFAVDRIAYHRFELEVPQGAEQEVMARCARIFGVSSVELVSHVPGESLEGIAQAAFQLTRQRVPGKTFAVRVKRRGEHDWRSYDLAVRLGDLLREAGGTVDLDDPEVTIAVNVFDNRAFVVTERVAGPGGLPIGSQQRVLTLVSGGFDSIVAAWMLMSRGCPSDFVHFSLNCAQSDHAVAVAHELWSQWGYGSDPTVHLVEFEPVKEALISQVESKLRQVSLKVLMTQAAASLARRNRIKALVTGDSLGQVSSQTLPHLVAVSDSVDIPVLRPLVGLAKEEIVDRARRIGTAELSARARELCDLSSAGPVATSARSSSIRAALARVPQELMLEALQTTKAFQLSDWVPGGV